MIRVEQLTGGYGKKPIVQGIDLEIKKGEFFALLGTERERQNDAFQIDHRAIASQFGRYFHRRESDVEIDEVGKGEKSSRSLPRSSNDLRLYSRRNH